MARPWVEALHSGLADAVGFLGGALLGWQAGRWLGFDVLAPGTAWASTLPGWLLLLAGCGAGKWASLRWQAYRAGKAAANASSPPADKV